MKKYGGLCCLKGNNDDYKVYYLQVDGDGETMESYM